MKDENQTILTELISLDTPGKATVEVVILADPVSFYIVPVGKKSFYFLIEGGMQADLAI